MLNFRFPSAWVANARDALARLMDCPWTLFVVLLAINALARPYAGITHDARLYSGQVLNQVEGGTYADDIFFRYGSQDQYSLFSRLVAPVVSVFGLPIGFFLIYLLSKTLLIWGMIRIVQTLVPNRTACVLALGYCMIVTVRYAGLNTLNVHEPFLTPRMPAIALVLFALDFLLRGRPVVSGLVLLVAAAVHPLMACGGILAWGAYLVWTHLGGKVFAVAVGLAVAAAAGILSYEPLAKRVFGEMDDAWRLTIMHASSFNFPSLWGNDDWWFLALQITIGAVVVWKYRTLDADKARFVGVLLIVTIVGAAGAILAEQLPYALLLQGQPYRALWLLGFLHIAFAFWLFVDWSQSESQAVQLTGAALLIYLSCHDAMTVELFFPFFVWPFLVLVYRGLEREPRDPIWLPHSIQMSVIVGAMFWMLYKYLILTRGIEALRELHPEMSDLVDVFIKNIGPIAMFLALAWILIRVGPDLSRPAVWLTAAAALLLQAAFFALPETDYYRDHCTQYRGDLHQIRMIINAERGQTQNLPTVYSNLGCLDYIWLDLHAKSYFDWWQAGNFMFRREMAMEGQRRACLVAAFEVERYRKYKHELTKGDKEVIGQFFNIDFDSTILDRAALAKLCQEPGLDYIVIEQAFDGLYGSQHGRLYLYRCRQVRSALGLPEPNATKAIAATR